MVSQGLRARTWTNPEDDLDVFLVPRVAQVVPEEAPGALAVFVGEEYAHTLFLHVVALVLVVPPDDAQKEGTGRSHDGDVRKKPAAVVSGQGVDDLHEEGVLGHAAHGVVGYAGRDRPTHPGRVREERIESALAALETLEDGNGKGSHARRPGRCIFLHSTPGRNSESRQRAGWGTGSRRTSPRTTGTRRR
jgi:hypothetical protein